jgi:hypothetical protein
MNRHPVGFAYPHELEPGDLIEWRHQAARVVEVRLVPEADWTDEDRSRLNRFGPRPFYLALRIVGEQRDRHYRYSAGLSRLLRVLPEHYSVCSVDGELMPCAHTRQERIIVEAMERLERTCAHCQRVIEPGHMTIRVRTTGANGLPIAEVSYHGAKRWRHCRAAGIAALQEQEPESAQLRWLA